MPRPILRALPALALAGPAAPAMAAEAVVAAPLLRGDWSCAAEGDHPQIGASHRIDYTRRMEGDRFTETGTWALELRGVTATLSFTFGGRWRPEDARIWWKTEEVALEVTQMDVSAAEPGAAPVTREGLAEGIAAGVISDLGEFERVLSLDPQRWVLDDGEGMVTVCRKGDDLS